MRGSAQSPMAMEVDVALLLVFLVLLQVFFIWQCDLLDVLAQEILQESYEVRGGGEGGV